MDEIEEGQLSSDVQNSSKDDLEDDIDNKLIKKKDDTNDIELPPNTDCVLCGSYTCICDDKNDEGFKLNKLNAETEEGEIVESDNNCSIKSKENNSIIKPLLNKKQAKKRLQAFSSEKKSLKRKKSVPAKVPKVVVSIETQYDENGEVTEDKLVIRKVPKIGPNPQEKAKSVISEIEEIKRRSVNIYNHDKMYPRSIVATHFKRHERSSLERDSKRKHSSHSEHESSRSSRKRRSRSPRERRRENDRKSSRYERNHKVDRHKNPATTWPEYQSSNRPDLSKRKVYDPIQFNMIMLLKGFEEEYCLKGTYVTAAMIDPRRLKFYYSETVKWTTHTPSLVYSPNLKHPVNLFPNRNQLYKYIPHNRIPFVKEFLNSCTNTALNLNHNNVKKQNSQQWYNLNFCIPTEETNSIDDKETINEKNNHTTDSSVVKSYGLSVLSENYQNHWGDESESETGKKSRITDVLPEDISPEENVLDFTPDNNRVESRLSSKEIQEEKRENSDVDDDPDVKTPDTDEYRSNWEVEEDPLIDYKSPQIWDSDDNSTLSRKASKKFQNNRYTNKKKFDFSDIAYNDKNTSNGLSDSFMNSFGYRRSTSRSDKDTEDDDNYKKDKYHRKDRKYNRNSDDSRSKSSKNEHETKRKHHVSKINLSVLEEDIEKKRKSIFKEKYYDDYDLKRTASRSSSDKSLRSSNHHLDKHWENDEEDGHQIDQYLSNRREKRWEDKSSGWKEDDINKFRMQEKIKLNESLIEEAENNSQCNDKNSEKPASPPPPVELIIEASGSNKPEEVQSEHVIEKPPSPVPIPQENSIEEASSSNNNSKLVSEYEEFMKTVGFEASIQDEIYESPEDSKNNYKTSEKIKHQKRVSKRHESSSSEDEDSDEEPRKGKKKSKKSSSSSSSDSSSTSSSSSSDSSESDSSDDDSTSSSSSSSSSKEDVEMTIDPLNIKVEKVSDDESKMGTKINLSNSIKEEQLEKQKESVIKDLSIGNETTQQSSLEMNNSMLKVPVQDNGIFDSSIIDIRNNTEMLDNSSVVNTSSATISLTLTPSKFRPQFKPLLLQSENHNSNTNVNTNPLSDKLDDTEIDFTDIIMKRSRDYSRTSQSPENKKQCIENKREKSKTPPDRHRSNDRRSERRHHDRGRSRERSRDHHYRDDSKYRERRSRDHSRDRRRNDYRHSSSRWHFESDSDRRKYYDDKYRDYRSDRKLSGGRVRRSRSPLDKRVDPKLYKRDDIEKYRNDREYSSNSPLDGFKRSLADSTISDSELLSQTLPLSAVQSENEYKKSAVPSVLMATKQTSSPSVESPMSPKRLSLDDRINQFLGIESEPPPRKMKDPPHTTPSNNAIYAQNSYDDYMSQDYYDRYANYVPPPHHYEGYHNHPVHNPTIPPPNFYPTVPPPTFNRTDIPTNAIPRVASSSCTQVVQVGNVLQVVPTELPAINNRPTHYEDFNAIVPKKEELLECTKTKVVQVGNMIQIVPAAVLPEVSVPQIQPDLIKIETKTEEKILVISSPIKIVEKALIDDDTVLKKKVEKEKRHVEREKRRAEREAKRKEKQKRKELRIKMKTEKMIKQALLMETSDQQVSDLDVSNILQDGITEDNENLNENSSMQSMWPPPAPLPIALLDPPSKGILMKTGFSKIKTDSDGQATSELGGVEDVIKVQKTVKFADGIKPGEGTSPSGGEDLPSPPPPKRKLPKEQRYKKTKLKTKKKVKVKIIRPVAPPTIEEEDSDDNLPPPPPPPGSPPPHLWPPKYNEPPIPYHPGPPPPHHPQFPLNHPPFPPNGAHLPLPPPGFIPPPSGALIPKNHCSLNTPPPGLSFSSQPPPTMFPPVIGGPEGPPPPPYLEGRPPSGINIPSGNIFVPKFAKM